MERDILYEIRKEFGQGNNFRVFRNNIGAAKDASGRLITFGTKGSPDLIGILGGPQACPHCRQIVTHQRGQWIGLEVKTEDGPVRPEQIKFREMAERYGGKIAVVRSLDDARDIMRFWGAEW